MDNSPTTASSGRRYFLVTMLILCLSFIFTCVFFSNLVIEIIPFSSIKRALSLSLSRDWEASDFPTFFESPSFSSNYSTSSLRRDRVIAYLIDQQRIDELSRSLENLFRYYNDRFRFPVLLFHDAVFNVQQAKNTIIKKISNERVELLEFHEVIGFTDFPPGFDIGDNVEKAKRENVQDWWRYPGYNHMISFWWRKVLLQPRMATVEYYMRLDSDSTIRAPINYDLFEFVHQKGVRYSYRAMWWENSCCAKYLYPFVYLYAKQN